MTTNGAWQEMYRAALLELRPEELQRRIGNAERAIQQRIAELKRNDSSSADESQALDDALRALRILADTECKTAPSARPGLAIKEVTS